MSQISLSLSLSLSFSLFLHFLILSLSREERKERERRKRERGQGPKTQFQRNLFLSLFSNFYSFSLPLSLAFRRRADFISTKNGEICFPALRLTGLRSTTPCNKFTLTTPLPKPTPMGIIEGGCHAHVLSPFSLPFSHSFYMCSLSGFYVPFRFLCLFPFTHLNFLGLDMAWWSLSPLYFGLASPLAFNVKAKFLILFFFVVFFSLIYPFYTLASGRCLVFPMFLRS